MRRALILVAALAVSGCGMDDDEPQPLPQSAARAAPGIAGTTLDGKRISLASFRGRPVVVNVWSSW